MITKAQRAALDELLKKWKQEEEDLPYPFRELGEIQKAADRETRARLIERREDLEQLLASELWRSL